MGGLSAVGNTNLTTSSQKKAVFVAISGYIYRIWVFFDVAKKTTKYNDELYRNLFGEYPNWKVSIMPTYQGANLSMTYSFK